MYILFFLTVFDVILKSKIRDVITSLISLFMNTNNTQKPNVDQFNLLIGLYFTHLAATRRSITVWFDFIIIFKIHIFTHKIYRICNIYACVYQGNETINVLKIQFIKQWRIDHRMWIKWWILIIFDSGERTRIQV